MFGDLLLWLPEAPVQEPVKSQENKGDQEQSERPLLSTFGALVGRNACAPYHAFGVLAPLQLQPVVSGFLTGAVDTIILVFVIRIACPSSDALVVRFIEFRPQF